MSTFFLGGGNVSAWSIPRVECTTMDIANTATVTSNLTGITWTISGVQALQVTSNGITAPAFIGNGTFVTTTHMSLTNVQITDNSFVPQATSALASNAVGYLAINGAGFAGTMSAVIGGTVLPTSLTTVSSTKIQMVLAPLSVGTYPLWVFSDQYPDVRMTTIQVL